MMLIDWNYIPVHSRFNLITFHQEGVHIISKHKTLRISVYSHGMNSKVFKET